MGIRLKPSPPDVTRSSLEVLTAITRLLAGSVQTPENRAQLDKWMIDLIWDDCGRHLKDIELKLMSLTVDILAALVNQTGDYPISVITSR